MPMYRSERVPTAAQEPPDPNEEHRVNFLFWRRFGRMWWEAADSLVWVSLFIAALLSMLGAYLQSTLIPEIGAPIIINTLALVATNIFGDNTPGPGLIPVEQVACRVLGSEPDEDCLKKTVFGGIGEAGPQATELKGSLGNVGIAYSYLGWLFVIYLATTGVLMPVFQISCYRY